MPTFLFLLALVGHAVLWITIVNRSHALGWHRSLIDAVTAVAGIALFGLPAWFLLQWWSTGAYPADVSSGWRAYGVAAIAIGLLGIAVRIYWALRYRATRPLLSEQRKTIDFHQRYGETLMKPGLPRALSRLPGNQLLKPVLAEKEILVPRLPRELDGVRIAHVTDLHMSGRIGIEYFRDLMQLANEQSPDLIAVTGDLVEHAPQLDWIEETLAKLTAPAGVYYVLGNHDRECDHGELRRRLDAAGQIGVAGRVVETTLRGVPVRIAGNELPWFAPATDLSVARNAALTIALAHSPDQFTWACDGNVDLLLAGHNHGGQICFPIIGPIVSPSIHGVRYAGGTFRRGDCVMHVSRGTGSLAPLRFLCPPELAVLTLRAAS